jgi:hypothetical protein
MTRRLPEAYVIQSLCVITVQANDLDEAAAA